MSDTLETPDPARDRQTTLRGLALLGWVLLFAVLSTTAAEWTGLGDVQSPTWPTDIQAFREMHLDQPPDLVILGSSRASFAMTPASFDACMTSSLGRTTTTFNLARTFATASSFERTWRTMLNTPERRPKVLLLALGPEALDDHNPMIPARLRADTPLADVPRELVQVRSPDELLAVLRAPMRGIENIVATLFQRHRSDERLTWMMVHYGGGQWCEGSGACTQTNSNNSRVANRWDKIQDEFYTNVRQQRFSDYTIGQGRVHERFVGLLDAAAAAGTDVVLVRLPLHDDFREAVPPEAMAHYIALTDQIAKDRGLTLFDAHKPSVTREKRAWIDPDHLGPRASTRLSREVCRTAVVPLLQAQAKAAAPAGGR